MTKLFARRSSLQVLFIASCCCLILTIAPSSWLQAQPSSPVGSGNAKSDILVNPSGRDLALIAYRLAGVEPPLEAWANADATVSQADEFKRAAALKLVVESYRSRLATLQGVDTVRIEMMTTFGEYNPDYNEFDMAIDDGTSVEFGASGSPAAVSLHLINGSLAQAWPLPAPNAQAVVAAVKGNRNVRLNVTIQLKDSSVVDTSTALTINGKILSYDVEAFPSNRRLGHVDVK